MHSNPIEISDAAADSLDEAGDELLTLHALGVSGDLRKSLSTTNTLESLFSVVRTGIGRNKRYPLRSQQKMRWIASATLEHQRTKMRRIRGIAQRNVLIAALGQKVDLKVA